MASLPKTVNDLKAASYNPRVITPKQLAQLQASIERYGDLSGVVFNVARGVLVSGHQRLKTVASKRRKIVRLTQNKKPDTQGTISVGFIEVQETDGSVTKIPYREVHWSDKLAEMAANVAANAAGGDFDQNKLGAILAKLERGGFSIEHTAIDTFTAGKAIGKFKRSKDGEGEDDNSPSGKDTDKTGGAALQVVDPKQMKFLHCCPRCGYQWGDRDKIAAKTQPKQTTGNVRLVKGNHKPNKTKKAKR